MEFILHSCIVDVKQLTADIDSFSPAFDIIWARYGHFFDKFQTRRDIVATFPMLEEAEIDCTLLCSGS